MLPWECPGQCNKAACFSGGNVAQLSRMTGLCDPEDIALPLWASANRRRDHGGLNPNQGTYTASHSCVRGSCPSRTQEEHLLTRSTISANLPTAHAQSLKCPEIHLLSYFWENKCSPIMSALVPCHLCHREIGWDTITHATYWRRFDI